MVKNKNLLKDIDFENKNVIITGASRGIGYNLSKRFIELGANLSLCSKNYSNLKKAVNKLNKIKKKKQKIFYMKVDISKNNDIKKFYQRSLKNFNTIHILVNNAGIYGPKGFSESVNWSKWVNAIKINLFGSVYITRLLIKHFKKNNYGKIIQLAGGGVAGPLPMMSAYGVSKVAVVRYMHSLSEEVKKYNININIVAPGTINTDMLKEILRDGKSKVGEHHYKKAIRQKKIGGTPMSKAVDLIIFLSSDISSGLKGKIINAIWDDWINLINQIKKIQSSDIFTLKRIHPSDRGFKWGGVNKKLKFDTQFGPYRFNKK